MTIQRHEYQGDDGFTRVVVQNEVIECEYLPALGGKMTRLMDRRTGREWLWRHPRMPYRQVPSTANYVAVADTGGWDECFPTVGPCDYPVPPWQGTALADHGELWCQTPTVTWLADADAVVYTCVWEGLTLPYTFMRSIEMGADATIDASRITAMPTCIGSGVPTRWWHCSQVWRCTPRRARRFCMPITRANWSVMSQRRLCCQTNACWISPTFPM